MEPEIARTLLNAQLVYTSRIAEQDLVDVNRNGMLFFFHESARSHKTQDYAYAAEINVNGQAYRIRLICDGVTGDSGKLGWVKERGQVDENFYNPIAYEQENLLRDHFLTPDFSNPEYLLNPGYEAAWIAANAFVSSLTGNLQASVEFQDSILQSIAMANEAIIKYANNFVGEAVEGSEIDGFQTTMAFCIEKVGQENGICIGSIGDSEVVCMGHNDEVELTLVNHIPEALGVIKRKGRFHNCLGSIINMRCISKGKVGTIVMTTDGRKNPNDDVTMFAIDFK